VSQHKLLHITEMSFVIIKDSLLHNCPQLSRISVLKPAFTSMSSCTCCRSNQ